MFRTGDIILEYTETPPTDELLRVMLNFILTARGPPAVVWRLAARTHVKHEFFSGELHCVAEVFALRVDHVRVVCQIFRSDNSLRNSFYAIADLDPRSGARLEARVSGDRAASRKPATRQHNAAVLLCDAELCGGAVRMNHVSALQPQ
jgi:hypothetical protein